MIYLNILYVSFFGVRQTTKEHKKFAKGGGSKEGSVGRTHQKRKSQARDNPRASGRV